MYGLDGNVKGTVPLPAAFEAPLRPDLVRKAVNAARANRRQPYGSDPDAGKRQVAETWGPGSGVSRIPRRREGSQAAFAPGTRGGRRAHAPSPRKVWREKVNRKEKALAFRAALAAAANPEAVRRRGHRLREGLTVPLVVEEALGDVAKTSELLEVLNRLGVASDVQRASDGTHQRAGKGKLRGRRFRVPRALLLVAPAGSKLRRAAANLPGVGFAAPEALSVEGLAPGGDAGRLLVITEGSLRRLGEVLA